jgi:hypothetical protein
MKIGKNMYMIFHSVYSGYSTLRVERGIIQLTPNRFASLVIDIQTCGLGRNTVFGRFNLVPFTFYLVPFTFHPFTVSLISSTVTGIRFSYTGRQD